MTRTLGIGVLLAALALAPACEDKGSGEAGDTPKGESGSKDSPKEGGDTPADDEGGDGDGAEGGIAALVDAVGIEMGGFEPTQGDGPEAVVSAAEGDLEVRRVGEETFEKAAADTELFPGDQVRTAAEGSAQLTMSDETVVELAESTAIAIADRDAGADPASSAAVLHGVARFTIAPRGTGEGPFLVYTPGGIVGSKSTVYAVGVAATGVARVGVEEGKVEVAGSSAADTAVSVDAGKSAEVSVEGKVSATAEFAADDWGEWRDGQEADKKPVALVEVHGQRVVALEAESKATYGELEALSEQAATAEAAAEAYEEAEDDAGYRKTAPGRAVAIEANFLASVRLQHLSYAMLTHAYLADELYVRHPEPLEPVYVKARPRFKGALLWHKKYHATVHLAVKPRRAAYYLHHPRGRKHAKALKISTPPFYAKAKIGLVPAAKVKAKFRWGYRAPTVVVSNRKKVVWVGPPRVGWHAKVKVRPAKYRGASWYVRAKAPKARLITGVEIKAKGVVVFKGAKRGKRAAARVRLSRGDLTIKSRAAHRRKVRVGANGRVTIGAGRRGIRVNKDGSVVVKGPRGKAGVKVGADGTVKGKGPRGKAGVKVGADGTVTVGKKGPRGKAGGKAGVKVKPGGGVVIKKKGGKVKTRVKVDGKGGVKVRKKRKGN